VRFGLFVIQQKDTHMTIDDNGQLGRQQQGQPAGQPAPRPLLQ
jgi:hypothetical protein